MGQKMYTKSYNCYINKFTSSQIILNYLLYLQWGAEAVAIPAVPTMPAAGFGVAPASSTDDWGAQTDDWGAAPAPPAPAAPSPAAPGAPVGGEWGGPSAENWG